MLVDLAFRFGWRPQDITEMDTDYLDELVARARAEAKKAEEDHKKAEKERQKAQRRGRRRGR